MKKNTIRDNYYLSNNIENTISGVYSSNAIRVFKVNNLVKNYTVITVPKLRIMSRTHIRQIECEMKNKIVFLAVRLIYFLVFTIHKNT